MKRGRFWRRAVGTRVVEGIGKMVVTAVGVNSAKGVICSLLGLTYNSVCILIVFY